MKTNRKLIAQATSLSSSDLSQFLLSSNLPLHNDYRMEIYHAKELSSTFAQQIVELFERNMKIFYEQSIVGYQPDEKREELFADPSRYLLILSGNDLLAFVHFRFDIDHTSRVLYLYELQVNEHYQRQGLGQWCLEQLKILCRKSQMTKIVLTVHKANGRAVEFYRNKCQFQLDTTDPGDEIIDYLILSFRV